MMKKQSSIEWLAWKFATTDIEEFKDNFNHIIEQAKEMEKQQIMKAVYESMGTNLDPNIGRSEQYYNEIYNK